MRRYQKENSLNYVSVALGGDASTSSSLPLSPLPCDSDDDNDMRKGDRRRKDVYLDENLFTPGALRDDETLEIALASVENAVLNHAVDQAPIFAKLMSVDHLLELVISGESLPRSSCRDGTE